MNFWVGAAVCCSALTVCGVYVGSDANSGGLGGSPSLASKALVKASLKPASLTDADLKDMSRLLADASGALRPLIGRPDPDGGTFRSGTVDGRVIRVNIQMPYDKYSSSFVPGVQERKRRVQAKICGSDLAKLFAYDVSWSYVYYDRNNLPIATMVVSDCNS